MYRSLRRQQSVTELVRVETLGELRHMPGSMVNDTMSLSRLCQSQ
jgi:hypothetical protein